jgi:hypothetical protein
MKKWRLALPLFENGGLGMVKCILAKPSKIEAAFFLLKTFHLDTQFKNKTPLV